MLHWRTWWLWWCLGILFVNVLACGKGLLLKIRWLQIKESHDFNLHFIHWVFINWKFDLMCAYDMQRLIVLSRGRFEIFLFFNKYHLSLTSMLTRFLGRHCRVLHHFTKRQLDKDPLSVCLSVPPLCSTWCLTLSSSWVGNTRSTKSLRRNISSLLSTSTWTSCRCSSCCWTSSACPANTEVRFKALLLALLGPTNYLSAELSCL